LKKAEQQIGILKEMDRCFEENGASPGEPTVLKGYDSVQTGSIVHQKWERISNAVAVSFDASRFDQHVSHAALKWEHGIYEYLYPKKKHPLFNDLLSEQLVNSCTYISDDGTTIVDARVKGSRMSGDMNTSMGNCLLMCALTKAYMEDIGIKIYACGNNGDDTFVIVDANHLNTIYDTIHPWFKDMGFKMTVERPAYVLEDLVFCQGRFIETDSFWHFTREPMVALTKDTRLTDCMPGRFGMYAHIGAIGECGLAGHACVPVMAAFYKWAEKYKQVATGKQMVRARQRLRNPHSGDWNRSKANLAKWYDRVDHISRLSFMLISGVHPHAQIELEESLSKSEVDRRAWVSSALVESHCLVDLQRTM
jgi:hypothetical protein